MYMKVIAINDDKTNDIREVIYYFNSRYIV